MDPPAHQPAGAVGSRAAPGGAGAPGPDPGQADEQERRGSLPEHVRVDRRSGALPRRAGVVRARRGRRLAQVSDPAEPLRPRARAGPPARHARRRSARPATRVPGVGRRRRRQVGAGQRAEQVDRRQERLPDPGQVRSVPAELGVPRVRPGLPRPAPAAARRVGGAPREVATRPARRAGAQRPPHRRAGPRARAHPRPAARRPRAAAHRGAEPLPARLRRLRQGSPANSTRSSCSWTTCTGATSPR